jgi:hypothetical protein
VNGQRKGKLIFDLNVVPADQPSPSVSPPSELQCELHLLEIIRQAMLPGGGLEQVIREGVPPDEAVGLLQVKELHACIAESDGDSVTAAGCLLQGDVQLLLWPISHRKITALHRAVWHNDKTAVMIILVKIQTMMTGSPSQQQTAVLDAQTMFDYTAFMLACE